MEVIVVLPAIQATVVEAIVAPRATRAVAATAAARVRPPATEVVVVVRTMRRVTEAAATEVVRAVRPAPAVVDIHPAAAEAAAIRRAAIAKGVI
jgi:hypothetical protein